MSKVFAELKRRNVFKVAAVYIVVAWLLLQVADVLLDNFGIPDWGFRFVTVLLIIGFPIALIFAWAFEMTPEGLKREREVDRTESITPQTGQKLNYAIIGLLAVALAYYAYQDYFVPDVAPTAAVTRVTEESQPSSSETPVQLSPSIAVLPFANRSADAENAAFFADGIHDDLLTILSKIGDLKVISRTSVERYRETDKAIPEIAAELGVSAILEGGVQRAGDRVRINMQLIDGTTDEHLWADSYDEELTAENVFDIQRRIAESIAESLQATLSPKEQADIAAAPTLNLAAYDAYLKGRERMRQQSMESLAEAAELFEQAIELDPEFAPAWVGLADSRILSMQPYFERLEYDETLAAIDTALELDPGLGAAYVSRGLLSRRDERYEDADVAYRRSLQLDPSNASAYHHYGALLLELRRHDEALVMFEKAAALDPLSPGIKVDMGAAMEAAGDYEAALAQYHKTIEMDPGAVDAYEAIGWLYWSGYGRLDEAVPWYRRALEVDPENYPLMYDLSQLYLDLGDEAAAEAMAKQTAERGDPSAGVGLMMVRAQQNRDGEAAELAGRILDTQPWPVTHPAIMVMGDILMRKGQYQEAVDMFRKHVPSVVFDEEPQIDSRVDRNSLEVAAALQGVGDYEHAQKLLDGSEAVMATGTRHAPARYDLAFDFGDIENLALRGKTEEALARLRQAIDDGWRAHWVYMKRRMTLASLHDHPDFQAMMAELEADMVEQRQRLTEASRATN